MKRFPFYVATTLLCLPAYSVVQGTLDPTSVGSIDITITIPERVQISGLQDINFGQYPGSGNLDTNYDLCVYSNTPVARYDITATGSGAADAFELSDGSGNEIPFSLFWNDETGTVGGITAIAGVTHINQTGANDENYTCATGGDSANIRVYVGAGDINGEPNGTYTGTITLLIEPS